MLGGKGREGGAQVHIEDIEGGLDDFSQELRDTEDQAFYLIAALFVVER